MNPIEILGSLLGGSKKGGVTDILEDMLGNRGKEQSRSAGSDSGSSSMTARDLEDMLGVGRGTSKPGNYPNPPLPPSQPKAPAAPSHPVGKQRIPSDIFAPKPRNTQLDLSIPTPVPSSEEESTALIRAMVNAAKVDGQISDEEQQFIIQQVGDTSAETVQFLRDELSKPINVREYAASVPLGSEEKAYLLSLMTVKLDSKHEADYLRSLASSLRLTPARVNQIHQQQNAPKLYS